MGIAEQNFGSIFIIIQNINQIHYVVRKICAYNEVLKNLNVVWMLIQTPMTMLGVVQYLFLDFLTLSRQAKKASSRHLWTMKPQISLCKPDHCLTGSSDIVEYTVESKDPDHTVKIHELCLFVLRFYGPVNPMGSCRARSVYLTTRYWAGLVL